MQKVVLNNGVEMPILGFRVRFQNPCDWKGSSRTSTLPILNSAPETWTRSDRSILGKAHSSTTATLKW